jgi:formylglycine-generating enzyme required for sulfatase activity
MKVFGSARYTVMLALTLPIAACSIPVQSESDLKQASFSDCSECPEMILIPSGTFLLGSDATEPGHIDDESPQVEVEISSFAASRYEITLGEFRTFIDSTGYVDETICLSMQDNGGWGFDPEKTWENPGFEQSDNHPVVCVSWNTANAYVEWLNRKSTPGKYRLLSESEWEYAARAGSSTVYWWGDNEDDFCKVTNGVDLLAQSQFPNWPRAGNCSDGHIFTAPVGHYQSPNMFGVEDMVGNVWEWVSDCYVDSHLDKPRDGTPQIVEPCEKGVMRGGAWGDHGSFYLRSAYRGAWDREQSFTNLGFRVAKTMED